LKSRLKLRERRGGQPRLILGQHADRQAGAPGQYQASQHEDAINGDREAIAMCLKIEEQRADFLGTRAPASLRIDPVQLMEQAQPQQTSTDRIREALDRIAAMKASGELPADKSVQLLRNRDANGSPSGDELDSGTHPKA
jgi:hypothetical protein